MPTPQELNLLNQNSYLKKKTHTDIAICDIVVVLYNTGLRTCCEAEPQAFHKYLITI